MAAPQVQSVEQIIGDLNPAYQGSIDVINKRRAQIPGQFEAQRTGLEAQKVQGFNSINDQAVGRGAAFSGIPLDEQATYLSTQYLPGMQNLAQQENQMNLSLDEALAGINQERRLRAMDVRQSQQSSLEAYLAEERQRQWEREQFQAQQAMEKARMAQQASMAAADRNAGASAQASQLARLGSLTSSTQQRLSNAMGRDKKVSARVWQDALSNWVGQGGSAEQFAATYGGYAHDHYAGIIQAR